MGTVAFEYGRVLSVPESLLVNRMVAATRAHLTTHKALELLEELLDAIDRTKSVTSCFGASSENPPAPKTECCEASVLLTLPKPRKN